MIKNIVAVVFMIIFLIELYFCTAGSNHRKKKIPKGWNKVSGKVESVEKVRDEISQRSYVEVTVRMPDGRRVYSKHSPTFCIYEKGEEVEMMEMDGVHRFVGNDRVNRRGIKETLLGTLPMLILIVFAAVLSYLAHIWS